MDLEKEGAVLQCNLFVSPSQLQKAATCFIAHKRRPPQEMSEFILFATPILILNSIDAIHDSLDKKLPPCTLELMRADAAEWVLENFSEEIPEYKLQLGTGESGDKCR